MSTEREAFEKWAAYQWPADEDPAELRDGDGYTDPTLNDAWTAWQAALAREKAEPVLYANQHNLNDLSRDCIPAVRIKDGIFTEPLYTNQPAPARTIVVCQNDYPIAVLLAGTTEEQASAHVKALKEDNERQVQLTNGGSLHRIVHYWTMDVPVVTPQQETSNEQASSDH